MIEVEDPVSPADQSGSSDTQDFTPSEHAPAPEARWQGKTDTVTLYSENVLQEPDSTEVVDRESIANLASTRRQWEAIFTSEPKEEHAPKPKKNPSKWQVRMPYTEKKPAGPATVSANVYSEEEQESPPPSSRSMADSESAIEREIRLAMEREEMLRQEQEERLRQQTPRGEKASKTTSSMESSTESELQPSFHELAEADRGSQFFMDDSVQRQEDAEREESLQRGFAHQKPHSAAPKSDNTATESIIEREIRQQKEREAELSRQRGGRGAPSADVPVQRPPPAPQQAESEEEEEMNVVIEEIPYEEAISSYSHEGESRIARELRELKEREEDVRKLRERMSQTTLSGGDSGHQKPAAPSSLPTVKPSPNKSVSAPQTPRGGDKSLPSTPRAPTISFSHSVHAFTHSNTDTTPPSSKTPTPKPETPIEREIRLARERENELRRSKGLPELQPEPKKQESFEEADREEVVSARRYHAPQPDSTMRRFASNRLQQEIMDQRNREMKLRQEGKIISTSEEHIQPLKYTEIVGQDQADGVGKRNFKTPASARRGSNASQDSNASGENTPRSQPAPATPRDSGGAPVKASGTRAISFSYREFAQTAESRIERELREMREREEELRQQRSGAADS